MPANSDPTDTHAAAEPALLVDHDERYKFQEVQDLLDASSLGSVGARALADRARPSSVHATLARAIPTLASTPRPVSPGAGEHRGAEQRAGVLEALADPARLRLLGLIQSAPEGEACVCDLTAPLGLSQPTVSHHLRVLTEAGLLEREKRGVWAYHRLAPTATATIAELLTPPRKRADSVPHPHSGPVAEASDPAEVRDWLLRLGDDQG